MIRVNSYQPRVNKSNVAVKKENSNIEQLNSHQFFQQNKNVAKSEHFKANFLTFTGKTENLSEKLLNSEGKIIPMYKNTSVFPAFKTFSSLKNNELIEGDYYSKTADDVAISLGPDKHIILVQEEKTMPEILVHNFTKNVKDGKYNYLGLNSYKTEIHMFNPRMMKPEEYDNFIYSVFENLSKFSSKNPENEKVVFVEHFEDVLQGFSGSKDYETIFDRETFKSKIPKIHIVALVPEKDMKSKTTEELMNGEKPKFDPKKLKYVRKVELNGLSAKKTKEFLKNEVVFLNKAFSPYEKIRFYLSNNAIDQIVDNSAYNYSGANPQKSLDVLDLIAAKEAKKLQGDGFERKKVVIDSQTVKSFFKEDTDLIKYMKLDDNIFTFAENVTTKMDDVGGATEAKEELSKIIEYAKDPKAYMEKSKFRSIPKGALLTGPPGTGKTLLAKAIAGEAGVPFSAISAPELLKKYLGEGEEAVRTWFKNLRSAAADSGSNVAIGFIDEIDAVGKIRSNDPDAGSEARASILNQLLTEIDGFDNKESNIKVILLAATNRDDILDPALKRAGRFDSTIHILPPQNLAERIDVFSKHTRNLPFESEASKKEIIAEIAELTEGMSGADISKLVALTKEIVDKRPDYKVITYNDMHEGLLQTIMGKKTYLDRPPIEKRRTAIHEVGHATLVNFFNRDLTLISNESRGDALGITLFKPSKFVPNYKSIMKEISISYAGGDTEALFNPIGHAAGVSQDLKDATNNIQNATFAWGLGPHTPQISFVNKDGSINQNLVNHYTKENKADIELFSKIPQKLNKLILKFHKDFIENVYMKKYDEEITSGKGGNVLSGKQFKIMIDKWLQDTGKIKQYERLQRRIDRVIEYSQKTSVKDKAVYVAKRFVNITK